MLWWVRLAIQVILVMAIISVIGYTFRNHLFFLNRKRDDVTKQKEEKKEERKKGSISRFFFKLAATLFIVWLALVYAAEIKSVATKAALLAKEGVARARTNAPLQTSTANALPQGKNVGGPLFWDKSTNVELRARIKHEPVDKKGICFAGIMLPGYWGDKKFATFEKKSGWEAYIVDYTTTNRFLEEDFLAQHGTSKKDVPVGIFYLEKLPKDCVEVVYPRNDTGRGDEPPVVVEQYLQVVGNGPREIKIETLKETDRITEYLVDVGVEETWVQIPTNVRWVCIAAIHTTIHQSSMDGRPVPAKGVNLEKENYQAVMVTEGERRRVLDKPLLLQPSKDGSSRIYLNLNIAKIDRPAMGKITPAKIIIVTQE